MDAIVYTGSQTLAFQGKRILLLSPPPPRHTPKEINILSEGEEGEEESVGTEFSESNASGTSVVTL